MLPTQHLSRGLLSIFLFAFLMASAASQAIPLLCVDNVAWGKEGNTPFINVCMLTLPNTNRASRPLNIMKWVCLGTFPKLRLPQTQVAAGEFTWSFFPVY